VSTAGAALSTLAINPDNAAAIINSGARPLRGGKRQRQMARTKTDYAERYLRPRQRAGRAGRCDFWNETGSPGIETRATDFNTACLSLSLFLSSPFFELDFIIYEILPATRLR